MKKALEARFLGTCGGWRRNVMGFEQTDIENVFEQLKYNLKMLGKGLKMKRKFGKAKKACAKETDCVNKVKIQFQSCCQFCFIQSFVP